ncbi:M67 family metallopeptidase [Altererythrobacter sp. CAU 1778]
MDVTLSQIAMDRIVEHARAEHPRECCGILLGVRDCIGDVVPAANVHATPCTHFEIDPQALVDAHRAARIGGPEVLGYYHSHPQGAARPSQTDQAMASGDGRIWLIAGRGDGALSVTLWRDAPGGFTPLSYRVTSA